MGKKNEVEDRQKIALLLKPCIVEIYCDVNLTHTCIIMMEIEKAYVRKVNFDEKSLKAVLKSKLTTF